MKQYFWDSVNHRKDNIKHTGYDYRGKVLRNSLSKLLYLDPKREVILDTYDTILTHLIDKVKHIKKAFNYTLEKEYRDFN